MQIKSISSISANAAEVEESQETLALLQILAIGRKQVERGQTLLLDRAISQVRKRLREYL